MPIILAATRFASVDRSSDRVALNYGIDVLAPLEKDALILTRGDENFGPIAYIQNVEGVRTDVVALDVELLRLSTYVEQVRRAHPEITIPFKAYDGGKKQSLNSLIAANIQDRPVYFLGNMPETAFGAGYDQLDVGLATKLVPKGAAADLRALPLLNPRLYTTLRYPDRTYPADSWETVIAAHYGKAAFDAGYALQSAGRSGAEDLYRKAMRLLPDFSGSYKNLAILLQAEGRNAEAADLLERYLARSPDDAEVDRIRTQIETLRGSSP
jgi:tetratricopeptide (TPR) repeat protein